MGRVSATLRGLRVGRKRREDHLFSRLDPDRVPRHIGVIMDGNGRWAARRGLPRAAGHRAGAAAVRRTVRAAARAGVDNLTLYAFSSENWRRPKKEIDALMDLFEEMVEREVPGLVENGISLGLIGDLDGLSTSTREAFARAETETAKGTGMHLVLALNYGGRDEIVRAVNRLQAAGSTDELSPGVLSRYMDTADMPDPEMIIRTSGEMRLSNFLLWQAAYSEFWVTRKLWPDFGGQDLYQAIVDFQGRARRFGGLAKED